MCKLSMRAILLSSILLLLRTQVHGQLNRPEWNVRGDADSPLREPPVEKAVNPVKTSEEGVDWSEPVQGAHFSRELVPGSLSNGLEHQPLGNAGKYLLPKNQNYPQRMISERIGLNTFSRPFQPQRSNMRENDYPAMDYTYDDIAQQLQPGYYPFSIPSLSSSVKARVKPRETAGLPRYLFSNFKRARDGYLCHFKLCQVGVSGKRLSM